MTTTGNEGFQFAAGWSVITQPGGASSFQDSLVSFTVTALSGSINDLHLFFNGSVTGTGSSGVTEQFCKTGDLLTCDAGNSGQIKVTNPPPAFTEQTFFPGVTSLSLSKDINVTSGTDGTSNISQVINTFSQGVPEPASLILLGAGLAALVGAARKR